MSLLSLSRRRKLLNLLHEIALGPVLRAPGEQGKSHCTQGVIPCAFKLKRGTKSLSEIVSEMRD